MPFSEPVPRNLVPADVHEHAPAASGLYGISNSREWIYIGETDNIREALLEHVREGDSTVSKRRPTGFVFEVCERALRAARQDRLILEYEPTCNRSWLRHP